MALDYIIPEFEVVRNDARCTRCRICESQCANGVHTYNADGKVMVSDESKCVNCQRCVSFCPTHAIKIVKSDNCLRENANWSCATIKEIYKQASTGGVLLSSMGNPQPLPVYWDRILINASQVTNPPIDPCGSPWRRGYSWARSQRPSGGTGTAAYAPKYRRSWSCRCPFCFRP